MNHFKKLALVGVCAASLAAPQAQANVCCGFLYVCEMLFNLGAGAGMAIHPGVAAALDPSAISQRGIGVALFLRGFRQFCSCLKGDGRDAKLNNLQNQAKQSENRNWKMQKTLAKLQHEITELKGKIGDNYPKEAYDLQS